MCASIHRGREVQAQFFIYVSSSPPPLPRSTKEPESFKHLAGTQKEDSGLGFFSMLMTIRGPEGLGHLREHEPFYREQVAGSARSARSARSGVLPSLYEYIEHPRDRRATTLHPYSG